MEYLNKILNGDCLKECKKIPDDSVNLIITSPPYADARKWHYGGIHPDEFAQWLLERTKEFLRILKPTGTFILNIKEKVFNGERHTYVIESILGMRKQGWLWTEEFIWHKKNCYPGKWPNRFRDAWERCLQFNKSKKFKMFQEAVMVPMGDWAEERLKKLGKNDVIRLESRTNSKYGKNISNWLGREMAYPTNVLHLSTECSNKNHSAVFPVALPEWFIKLFTEQDDVVLDPFGGSGTTAIAAIRLKRNFILIDSNPEFCKLAEERIKSEQKNKRPYQERIFSHSKVTA
ncbi:MAG: DNA-methyltransferase [Thermodesulfovibrionales bacterium]